MTHRLQWLSGIFRSDADENMERFRNQQKRHVQRAKPIHAIMKSSSGGVIGGSTHVQLSAIAGLASTQTAPFVRILHEDVIAMRYRREGDGNAVVALEIPEDRAPPDQLNRAHHRHSEYTAHWSGDNLASIAILPIEADWIELQVWNRFTDVAVFLGATSISLRALQRNNAEEERSSTESKRLMWFPLDSSKEAALLPQSLSRLSVQVSISFHRYDGRTQRIQQQISERRRGRVAPDPNNEQAKEARPIVVDPSFQFTQPSSKIEWSWVVAANVRRIFLQGDVDELLTFFGDVAHGDMEREIEEDDEFVVDEEQLKAFRLAQLSTQYVEHCVELLSSRRDQYEEHNRVLRSVRRNRRREHKELIDQKRRLQKELEEVDLLTSTYGKLLEQHGHQEPSLIGSPQRSVHELSSPHHGFRGELATSGASSPVRESSDVVSKRPSFLMTWEEREEARRQQKELDKARRIEDEKVRLQNLFKDRQKREQFEAGITGLALRRQVRCVIKLQRMARSFMKKRRSEHSARRERAATRIQTHLRRFLCQQKWPPLRQKLLHHREHRLMVAADRESAAQAERERERDLVRQQQEQLPVTHGTGAVVNNDESEEELGDPVRALDLVATWKKLKRIFTLACQKGAHSTSLFAKLDSRADGVVDRAEFRSGIRYFGIRIDRKMTRAIIALVRAKCEIPTKPLTMTLAQFTRGFDLPAITQETLIEQTTRLRPKDDTSSNAKATDHIREATRSSPGEEFQDDDRGDDEDRSTSMMIEEVANAVSSLRRRVLEAAADHLNALNKSTDDYFAFREALTHVFQEFDVDGNGELDVEELVDCMASINFRVTRENVAILKECFVSDPTASDSISISEFISFALAGIYSSSSSPQRPVEEELGILGYRLRDAILERIKLARKHTDSIEDAVRWVFKNAYRSNHQLRCARRDFVRVLASLRLGFTPAQLSRLVLRLDQDGDSTISFDELLSWLRLRVSDSKAATVTSKSTIDRHAKPELDMASVLRRILRELAELDSGSLSHKQSLERAVELFERIDDNHSKKINVSELASFFYSVDLTELRSVVESGQQYEALVSDPTRLAEEIVKLIDLNGNGVITLEEWTGLLLGEQQSKSIINDRSRAERYAIVEGIRLAMRAAFSDEPALLEWFQSIPGAVLVDKTRHVNESKVRAREFKNAMRTKFPFISAKDVDEATKLLDADGSGWITEKEILQWQFPTRDIEELRVVIARVWASERESTRLKGISEDRIVESLYQRFDRDGNGLIARNELRAGFQSFRVTLNNEEAESVIQEFDTDKDGFWNKADFTACVRQLTPMRSEKKDAEAEHRVLPGSDDNEGYNSPDAGHEDHVEQRNDADSGAYSSEDDKYAPSSSGSYSLGELSPLAMSPPRFAQPRQPTAGPVEYSEDFDEDA